MRKADQTMPVNDCDQRHAAQLEKLDLLLVAPRHCVIRIGQADKRDALRLPIDTERARAIRTDRQHLRPAARELLIFMAQARQLRAAVGSQETAQKSQHDDLTAIIRKVNETPARIRQFKFRRGFTRL